MLRVPAVLTAAVVGALGGAATGAEARANPAWGINGTYVATSNGEWARKNEVFYDQASLRSTWTVSTSCSYLGECTGTVHSDWGWTAPIYARSGVWYVKHTIEDWVPCPDGSTAPGLQTFRFADDAGGRQRRPDVDDPGRRGHHHLAQRRLRCQQAGLHQHAVQARQGRLSQTRCAAVAPARLTGASGPPSSVAPGSSGSFD